MTSSFIPSEVLVPVWCESSLQCLHVCPSLVSIAVLKLGEEMVYLSLLGRVHQGKPKQEPRQEPGGRNQRPWKDAVYQLASGSSSDTFPT